MARFYRTVVLTGSFAPQRGRVRGAPTRWCASWQFNRIHSEWNTMEFNMCAWNLHVLNRNKESRHVYLSSLIMRYLGVQLVLRFRVRSLVVSEFYKEM